MKVKSGLKQTEVGVLPEDWKVALLDAVAKRGSGHTPDKTHPEYWGGQIKWISLQDSDRLDRLYIDDTAAKITPAGIANSSARMHPAGTVVMTRDAGVGKSAIMASDMAVSQHIMAWTCGPLLHNRYLYYWLQANKSEFERIAMGNTIKTIGLPYFKKLVIPLPINAEQEAIAEVLSDADVLIDSLNQLLAKKRQLKQGATQKLLVGKKRLLGFSGEWKRTFLGDIADLLKGSGLSRAKISASGTRPCVLYGELFTNYGRVITRVVSRTDSGEGRLSVSGDVLMPGSTTTTGIDLATASALLMDNVALGGDINVVRRKSTEYDATFLANYLTYAKRNAIAGAAQGITIHHLYGRDLKRIALHLPPLPEQTAIAAILSDMDAEIATLEVSLTKVSGIKLGMVHELLNGRIRLV